MPVCVAAVRDHAVVVGLICVVVSGGSGTVEW